MAGCSLCCTVQYATRCNLAVLLWNVTMAEPPLCPVSDCKVILAKPRTGPEGTHWSTIKWPRHLSFFGNQTKSSEHLTLLVPIPCLLRPRTQPSWFNLVFKVCWNQNSDESSRDFQLGAELEAALPGFAALAIFSCMSESWCSTWWDVMTLKITVRIFQGTVPIYQKGVCCMT